MLRSFSAGEVGDRFITDESVRVLEKHTPTIFRLSFSLRSRFWTSASIDILQSSTPPDVTSMKLSIPNLTREMLPASAPATSATSPSKLFHVIVKYSNCFPRRATACRSSAISTTNEHIKSTWIGSFAFDIAAY